jgi:hypothetical protein
LRADFLRDHQVWFGAEKGLLKLKVGKREKFLDISTFETDDKNNEKIQKGCPAGENPCPTG